MDPSQTSHQWSFSKENPITDEAYHPNFADPAVGDNEVQQIDDHGDSIGVDDSDTVPGDGEGSSVSAGGGNGGGGKSANKTKRRLQKSVPWSEQEHQLFLIGLQQFGKGQWTNIARHCVKSRTPVQVASHAQKYYKRQKSDVPKRHRRYSVHDTTSIVPPFLSSEYRSKDLATGPIYGYQNIMQQPPANAEAHQIPLAIEDYLVDEQDLVINEGAIPNPIPDDNNDPVDGAGLVNLAAEQINNNNNDNNENNVVAQTGGIDRDNINGINWAFDDNVYGSGQGGDDDIFSFDKLDFWLLRDPKDYSILPDQRDDNAPRD